MAWPQMPGLLEYLQTREVQAMQEYIYTVIGLVVCTIVFGVSLELWLKGLSQVYKDKEDLER